MSLFLARGELDDFFRTYDPDDVAAPALYWYTVGLYGESRSTRLPVFVDGTSLPDDAVRLGQLRVPGSEKGQPKHQVDYRFGSAIRPRGTLPWPPATNREG